MAVMESKYRVEKCIGRGNYGTVYLVHSIQNKKQYVLKRITFENMPAKDRTHVAAEVKMLSRLNHPNIVSGPPRTSGEAGAGDLQGPYGR